MRLLAHFFISAIQGLLRLHKANCQQALALQPLQL